MSTHCLANLGIVTFLQEELFGFQPRFAELPDLTGAPAGDTRLGWPRSDYFSLDFHTEPLKVTRSQIHEPKCSAFGAEKQIINKDLYMVESVMRLSALAASSTADLAAATPDAKL